MEKINLRGSLSSITKEYLPLGIKIFICSVQLLVSTSLAQAVESKKDINTENITDKSAEISQLKTGTEILSNISFLIGKEENKVSITKIELNNLYETYINPDTKLLPNLEILIKDFLLDCYKNILEVGYTLNGYKELDEIKDIISVLSDGKLAIRLGNNMPQYSEFTDKITIVGKQIGDQFLINKKGRDWTFQENNIIKINIDAKKILDVMLSDLPKSYTQALEIIASKNAEYLSKQDELRGAKNDIRDLTFKIEDLNKKNKDLEEKRLEEGKKAIADAEKSKKIIEKENQDAISQLNKTHEGEIAKLQSQMTNKDTDYKNLQESFDKAIKKAEEKAIEKERLANEKLIKEQNRLQKIFDTEKEKLNLSIASLNKDIVDQVGLINALKSGFQIERVDLKKISDNLNIEVTSLKREIISLNQTIDANKTVISDNKTDIIEKNKKIEALKQEKESIIAQNLSVSTASSKVLLQTQEKLKSSENTVISLESQIKNLEQKIKLLEKNNTVLNKEALKVVELEAKAKEFEKALNEIITLKNNITGLKIEVTKLEEKITSLQEENKILQTYKTKADDYDSLKKESDKKDITITKLKGVVDEKDLTIADLKSEKTELGKEIIGSQKKSNSLQSQLDEMKKKFDELISGTMIISDDKKSGEAGKLTKIIGELKLLLDKKTKEYNDLQLQFNNTTELFSKEDTQEVRDLQTQLDALKKQILDQETIHDKEIRDLNTKHAGDLEQQKRLFLLQ